MEVSVRPPKHHYDVISNHCVSTLAYFIKHNIGYQLSKFQCSRMSGSGFMDGGGPPFSATMRLKNPVLMGLRNLQLLSANIS